MGGERPSRGPFEVNPRIDSEEEVARLVAAVLAGDRGAMHALYQAHVHLVETIVRDFVHDRETVADAVQEVFARALDNVHRIREPRRFRHWLESIARHVGLDHLRRTAPKSLETVPEAPSPQPGPAERAETADLMDRVRAVLVTLSPRDSTVLGLLAVGFGPEEIAEALAVSRGAAKVAVHRARRRLLEGLAHGADPRALAEGE